MPAYAIDIIDPKAYDEYRSRSLATVQAFGGASSCAAATGR